MSFVLEEELKKLPDQPGVYIMHDEKDAIIYIGKALSLRHRVRQYFQASHNEGIKKAQMVKQIATFEYIVTDSELEALVLECNLIKEHTPKYNTMLRDDKTYPYIKVTLGEEYPRVLFSRQMKKDKSKYFGPYTSAAAVKDTIDLLQKLYQIRTCNRKLPENFKKERPCLNYHMKQCKGVCQGTISKEEYGKQIQGVLEFLNGNYEEILSYLQQQMDEASKELEFEKAATYRDLLQSVNQCAQSQKITDTAGTDQDIIALAQERDFGVVQVFFVRNGKLMGREHFFLKISIEDTRSMLLERFVQQFYGGTPYLPKEIYLQEPLDNMSLMEEWLSQKRGQKVYLKAPQRGKKEKLVELAYKNAQMVLSQDKERLKREEGRTIGAVKEIAKWLNLPEIIRMEAFDISNISGYQMVGSMVVFENGKPKRSDYRKFRLKGMEGPDDYGAMRQVLQRRFLHGKEEQATDKESSFSRFPDLILMDGGKGQVQIAKEVLEELQLSIPVCGMVKDNHHRTRGLYVNGTEIPIDKTSEGFHLITRIQDEAHRFAITYHRSLRSKEQVKSFLDEVAMIGPKRRKELMAFFSNVEEMRQASVEQLEQVPGMNRQAAQSLYDYFQGK